MDIDSSIVSGIISKNILSLEYEAQQMLENQIAVEASASKTKDQKDGLEELYKSARVYLSSEENEVYVSFSFLSIPKGMEDYADMIKSNAAMIIEPYIGDRIEDIFSLDEAQELIRNEIKQKIADELQNFLGDA